MIDPGGLLHERPFTCEGNYLIHCFECSIDGMWNMDTYGAVQNQSFPQNSI